jgi:PEP-CTERM motif
MRRFLSVIMSLTTLALAGYAAPVRSAVIDTFSFSDTTGWQSPPGIPSSSITGTFAGTVESDGLINLGDLTDFNISAFHPFDGPFGGGLAGLSFFSYNTTADPGTLGFVWHNTFFIACMGAPVGLSPSCNPVIQNSPTAHAVLLAGGAPIDFTTNFPTITLVSSVNTTAPEPSTWAMMLVGFAGLGFVGYRRSLKALDIG